MAPCAQTADAVHRNMVETIVALAAHLPGGFVERFPAATVAVTRSPLARFNEVLPDRGITPTALAEALRPLRDLTVPWCVHVPGDLDDGAVRTLRDARLEEVRDYFVAAMALTGGPPDPPAVPGLDIARVTARAGFEAFVVAAGPDPDLTRSWLGIEILCDPNVELLVGVIDGAPVATSMCVRTPGVVGVYAVNVVEKWRRRGYGWAMTAAAIASAADADGELIALQSSRMGYPMYVDHGFRTLYTYRCYLREPNAGVKAQPDR